MRYMIKGVLILAGIIMIALFISACTPNRALTRDSRKDRGRVEDKRHADEFSYDDHGRDLHDSYDQDDGIRIKEGRENSDSNDDRYTRRYDREDDDGLTIKENIRSSEKERFYQTGIASWYGREFQGRLTASGERFNMNEMTAAHKRLPFGTVVSVKNLDNGKVIRVRINDRGPYRDGRIIDLSYKAARRLDILRRGKAKVGIRILRKGDDDRYTRKRSRHDEVEPVSGDDLEKGDDYRESDRDLMSDSKSIGEYSIQAGAFYSRRNAVKLRKTIAKLFDNPIIVIRDGDFYKVKVEGIKNRREARRYKRFVKHYY